MRSSSPPRGGKVELLIENHDTGYTLQVTDNAYGIPTSEQHRLFERFFRSTTVSARESCLGQATVCCIEPVTQWWCEHRTI